MSRIAWIGLGNMGLPMATNLLKAGHTIRGVEPSPKAAEEARKAGIEIFDTITDAVRGADAVFTMLANGHVLEQVLTAQDGVFAAAAPGTLVVDSSTVGVDTCRKMKAAADKVGVDYADAPVSGGVTGAQSGTLTIMVGADEALFDRLMPLLDPMGGHIVRLGPTGSGLAAKIVNNMVTGICLAATCEGLTLAERLELDPAALFDVMTQSTGDNWVLRNWYPVADVLPQAPAAHNFAAGFKTSLLVKDLGLALAAGEDTGAPLATATTAHKLFDDHAANGSADLDCSSLILSLDKIDLRHTAT
jgi:3-hydroxyisobutyrate dehydrogenase